MSRDQNLKTDWLKIINISFDVKWRFNINWWLSLGAKIICFCHFEKAIKKRY
jgi:hypothetical protein